MNGTFPGDHGNKRLRSTDEEELEEKRGRPKAEEPTEGSATESKESSDVEDTIIHTL